MIKEHDIVALVCDLPERGLKRGQIGAVVMAHDSSGYEVEFVDSDHKTIAVISLSADLVRPTSADELSPPPVFLIGDTVQRVNQPESIGIVRDIRWDDQAHSWNYSVQIGSQLKVVPEELLQPVLQITSPWDALRRGSFSGVEHFVFTLTFHRLRRPPTRIAYSFATSRTQFYPHQFKPLLKFLDNPAKRLLIADDVGLGKTIEAGYILRELQARQSIERVLVLVPARLTGKWKRELFSRFEEHFEVVGRSELLGLASRLRQGREPEAFKWVVSYESARADEVRAAIDETLPPIDILIADEAHRMRNSETLQHRLGAALCRCAEVSIFLSATPVQNRLDDLWNLLRLLSSQEFSNWQLFENQIHANALLLNAQHALAERPPDTAKALNFIDDFLRSRSGRRLASTDMAGSIRQRLSSPPSDRRDIVDLQADIGSISPIGHVLSRTRKAEALPNRPRREAYWWKVNFSPREREVYEGVEDLCRKSWSGHPGSWGFQMSLLMAYRMTASCLPAAMRYFSERLRTNAPTTTIYEEIEEVLDEPNSKNSTPADLTAWPQSSKDSLSETVASYDWKDADSKLDRLVEFLESVWREDDRSKIPHRKVVVFSYFRRTLEYLAKALHQRTINNRMIHGGIEVDQRELSIDDFLERSDVPILLTSEVGGEGIDLQRASVVVNYDLPWNPMVVEQRIGRVDRIGQESARIIVCNLVVENSIEERVVQRLLDKLGIFQESIGELDPIIGDEIERLGEQALRGELTQEELERIIEERGDTLANQVREARKMLSRVDGLLAADQGLIDEISAVTEERQIPSERDLLRFLNAFLAERVPGCQIPKAATRDIAEVDLRGRLPVELEVAATALHLGGEASTFARRIMTAPIHMTLSREAGYRHPRAELLHLRHPLVRFAVAELQHSPRARPAAFALSLRRSETLAPGRYAFAISLVEIRGQRPTIKLAVAIGELEGITIWSDPDSATRVVLELLERGENVEIRDLDARTIEAVRNRLLNALSQLVNDWSAREQRVDKARRELQRAAQLNALELRVQTEQERLKTLENRQISGFPIRMAGARLEKARRELAELSKAAQMDWWGGVEQEEIAVGILQVA